MGIELSINRRVSRFTYQLQSEKCVLEILKLVQICITKDQVTTMVVFLIPEDKERWGQDLHRTTSLVVVTKDKKQKVMGFHLDEFKC